MVKLKFPQDWVTNAGIVGYLRCLGFHDLDELDYCDAYDPDLREIEISPDFVDEDFVTAYFNELADLAFPLSYYNRLYNKLGYLIANLSEVDGDNSTNYVDQVKLFVAQTSQYLARRGVISGVSRLGVSLLLDNIHKPTTKEFTSKVVLDKYFTGVSSVFSAIKNDPERTVQKIDAINSYLSRFLGSKFSYVAGGKKTQNFEDSFTRSIIEPLLSYFDTDAKKCQYRDSFTGVPMSWIGNPSTSTKHIANRASSVFEGVYYEHKRSVGWKVEPDFVGTPVTAFLLALAPLGMTSVGNRALFMNNTTEGLPGLFQDNQLINAQVNSMERPTFGKEIREIINKGLTNKAHGDNVIYVDLTDGSIGRTDLSKEEEKELVRPGVLLCLSYYYKKYSTDTRLTCVFDEVLDNVGNLGSYIYYVLHRWLESPDDFRFPVAPFLISLMIAQSNLSKDNTIDVNAMITCGRQLADNFVSVTGNTNKVNKLTMNLIRQRNSSNQLTHFLSRVYQYSYRDFPYSLYRLLKSDKERVTTVCTLILGIKTWQQENMKAGTIDEK